MISSYNDFASVPMMHGQDGQGAEWRTGSLEPPAIQTNLTNASDEEEEKNGGGQMRFKTVHAGVLGECSAQLRPLALQSLPFFSLNASRPCENGVWSARSLQLSLSLDTTCCCFVAAMQMPAGVHLPDCLSVRGNPFIDYGAYYAQKTAGEAFHPESGRRVIFAFTGWHEREGGLVNEACGAV